MQGQVIAGLGVGMFVKLHLDCHAMDIDDLPLFVQLNCNWRPFVDA
jgi:hypothetical protein